MKLNSVEEHIYSRCLDKIDLFFVNILFNHLEFYEVNIQNIYGGLTIQNLEERRKQHIREKQPEECNHNWKIIPVAFYEKTNGLTVEGCLTINRNVEKYLFLKLNEKYRCKCLNVRDTSGNIVITGGITEEDLTEGRMIKFYIFYKKQ